MGPGSADTPLMPARQRKPAARPSAAQRRQVPAQPGRALLMAGQPLAFDYVARTRALPVNLLFLVPFVLIYEAALIGTRSPVENAAAAWLRGGLASLGHGGLIVTALLLGLVFLLVVAQRAREAPRERGIYGGMLLEGTLYGLLLGGAAHLLASSMPMGRVVPLAAPGGTAETMADLSHGMRDLGLAVGAGVFEELVFRGLLLAGLAAVLRYALTADRLTSGVVALLISSYVFSAYHHWGPYGEPYRAAVFAFRFHAGMILGALFLFRGLGIAALAHGVYDVLVMLG
jgi:membrane protease YdiL (CAAX protease family)